MPLHKISLHNRAAALFLALALGAPLALSPVGAQTGGPAISIDQARKIATENGVVRIEEIELDDGKWEIEGRDAAGAEIEIDLRASDGMVVKMERDRPASASTRP